LQFRAPRSPPRLDRKVRQPATFHPVKTPLLIALNKDLRIPLPACCASHRFWFVRYYLQRSHGILSFASLKESKTIAVWQMNHQHWFGFSNLGQPLSDKNTMSTTVP
jgi:hypothetical protein